MLSCTRGRVSLLLIALLAACHKETGPGPAPGAGGGPDAGMPAPSPDGGQGPDEIVDCGGEPMEPTEAKGGECRVVAGGPTLLLRGSVITPSGLVENGGVLVNPTGQIVCAGCGCGQAPEAAGATSILCPSAVISPGLINAHDHITFTEARPAKHDAKYTHRHQWRKAEDGLPAIPARGNRGGDHGIWWGELRQVMSGATSINGSGGAAGLARNLDQPAELQEGLGKPRVRYSTFPLRDSGGTRRERGCDYGSTLDDPSSAAIKDAVAYTPHIAEGTDDTARNEFLCLSRDEDNSPDRNVITNKTGVIHGIGLVASDFRTMATARASLIWSPRSNIDLYGDTAQIVLAKNSGVRVALGSDWTISGSMNMLRELACARELAVRNYGGALSDRELVDMATVHAAHALGSDDRIGVLAPGFEADIAIFGGSGKTGYRAILEAEPADVRLVLRGGKPLYGDETVVRGLPRTATGCEALDVCGAKKTVCAERETGATLETMKQRVAGAYPLFFCGTPEDEPTCIPSRSDYMGVPVEGDADGDGQPDALDDCPTIFNPVRLLDDGRQADEDHDGVGDACDPCPLDANTSVCSMPDPNDVDGDGRLDAEDNCRTVPNMDQADRDGDHLGDACDECPDAPNVGTSGCPATIQQIKQGQARGRVHLDRALVTAVGDAGFYVQSVPGDAGYDMALGARFCGLYVYLGAAAARPAPGDRVDIDGIAGDFHGTLQLDASSRSSGAVSVRSSGEAVPDPVPVRADEIGTDDMGTDGPRAGELEGMLVEVSQVEVTSVMPPPDAAERAPTNEFEVDHILRVDDYFYLASPLPSLGERLDYVRGVLRHAFNRSKLEPRSAADLAAPVRLARIEPATLELPSGLAGVPPGGLKVVLTRPAPTELTITLSSSSPEVITPAKLVVPSGSSEVDLPLTVSPTARGSVTITATGPGSAMVLATAIVYDDAAPRRIVSFDVNPPRIPVEGMATATVELDAPGALSGTTRVTLEVTPRDALVATPAEMTVAPGSRRANFTLKAGSTPSVATVVAHCAASTSEREVPLYVPMSRPAMPGDLLITELYRNPPGDDERVREWFEVFNASSVDIELDGVEIGDSAHTFMIRTGATIGPGAHVVFAYASDPAVNGGLEPLVAYGSVDIVWNNGTDEVRILRAGMVIDSVRYTPTWPGGGQGVSMCLRAPYPASNDDPAAWGVSTRVYVQGALGSPGLPNDAANCP